MTYECDDLLRGIDEESPADRGVFVSKTPR